uniref:Uncharacterized protein n=1 Tax=Anguilla anguilla TaxID=7936 RepID=A0A0E9WAY1_ANGAN
MRFYKQKELKNSKRQDMLKLNPKQSPTVIKELFAVATKAECIGACMRACVHTYPHVHLRMLACTCMRIM